MPVNEFSFREFFHRERSRGARLSLVQRASIIALHSLGFGIPNIVDFTCCDPRTVQYWIEHFAEHGDLEDQPRSGRPPVTDTETNESIVTLAEEIRFISPREIRTELQLSASARTVRRRLDDAGLFGRVARVSYPFTQEHIDKRLAFVQKYGNWTESQWDRVLFSDETHFYRGGAGQVWVQRPEDEAFNHLFMVERYPHPDMVSLWACFSAQGTGSSRMFEGRMNSEYLIGILGNEMISHARRTWPDRNWFFLQDNAPYHSSHVTQNWLRDNQVPCIDFPPYSPDLNPIENLWNELKQRVENRCPSNKEEMKQFITEEWANLDDEYLSDSHTR